MARGLRETKTARRGTIEKTYRRSDCYTEALQRVFSKEIMWARTTQVGARRIGET